MEVAVRAGGPLLALIGFTIMPLVWSLPEAAMTTELSVAFPEVMDMHHSDQPTTTPLVLKENSK